MSSGTLDPNHDGKVLTIWNLRCYKPWIPSCKSEMFLPNVHRKPFIFGVHVGVSFPCSWWKLRSCQPEKPWKASWMRHRSLDLFRFPKFILFGLQAGNGNLNGTLKRYPSYYEFISVSKLAVVVGCGFDWAPTKTNYLHVSHSRNHPSPSSTN